MFWSPSGCSEILERNVLEGNVLGGNSGTWDGGYSGVWMGGAVFLGIFRGHLQW